MKKIKKYFTFFTVGGSGYAVIEILWRGHTHWTMVIAGGICFISFSVIAELFCDRPLIFKAFLSSVSITVVELAFGVIFNIILGMHVWDYSGIPLNFMGQVCPLFSLLWGALGLIFIPVASKLNEKF